MLLIEARRSARVSAGGDLISLDEQNRATWDAELIAEGHRLVRERLVAAAAGVAPGRYQILAAINAVHTSAQDVRDTDWSQVVALYDQFIRVDPSPIIALNRAIAVAELDGPQVALTAVDVSRTPWPAITPTTQPAPTCCADWAAALSHAPRMTGRSSWRVIPPRPPP